MGLRGIVQMLTIIHLMKVTDGSPMTMIPKTELLVTTTKGCEGEDKLLLTEDHSPIEDILTYEWVYSTRNVSSGTTKIILCQKTSGGFAVNPSYHEKVEYCNTSGIQLKNVSLNDLGYYKLQFMRKKTEHKESQMIFLTVSATPTEQCKPVIINHSGNVLRCTTHCRYLDLQWIWNKTESIVGNQSDLPISCSLKNEVILCCPKGQAMGCYEGSQYDLCTPTISSSCIENKPGAPNRSDSNLLGLLTLVIIPVILVILWIFCRNKIKSWTTMCHNRKNKSTLSCQVNTQEEALNLLKGKEEPDSKPTVEVMEEPESTPTVEVKGEPEQKSDSTPTQLSNEKTVPLLKETAAADCNPTKLSEEETVLVLKEKEAADCNPTQLLELETNEKNTEHELNTDSELMREQQELCRKLLCKICFTNKINMLYIPCRHFTTCANCSDSLRQCPVCRAQIIGKMSVLFE